MTTGGGLMRAEILLIEPMMAPIEASLDENYHVHRLFEAQDRTAFLADIAPRIRAIATGGATGASNDLVDGLPALEIIAINGIGTGATVLHGSGSRAHWPLPRPGSSGADVLRASQLQHAV